MNYIKNVKFSYHKDDEKVMKFISFQKHNSTEILERVERYIEESDCPEMGLDISSLNIFDASRVMLVSSALHYSKYPEGKLRCKVQSKGIENLIGGFSTKNLEIL